MRDKDSWEKIQAIEKNSHCRSFDQADFQPKSKNSNDKYQKKLRANNSMSAYNNIFITGICNSNKLDRSPEEKRVKDEGVQVKLNSKHFERFAKKMKELSSHRKRSNNVKMVLNAQPKSASSTRIFQNSASKSLMHPYHTTAEQPPSTRSPFDMDKINPIINRANSRKSSTTASIYA
jgi:hypothetical protein